MELIGNIDESGRLMLAQREELNKWIAGHKGNMIALSVKVKGRTRSKFQNAYYWKVIVAKVQEAMNSFGNDYSKEEVHEFLKKEFNWEEKEMQEGYYVKVPRSTTRLTTSEFNDYKEKIQQFASLVLGIYIPDPGESSEVNF